MTLFTQHRFTGKGIRSLSWRGDELVDWVSGGRVFALDGTERRAQVSYSYRFDAATASPDGDFAVIYERLGTKGLLLKNGNVLRELNRSFYHANAYEYPVALIQEPAGRLLLAHCPSEYCRIELEEAETGRPVTASGERKPADFFHSRLAASPGGKRLLSAGWCWHPWSLVGCFELERAFADPNHLDSGDCFPDAGGWAKGGSAEGGSACWLDDDRVAVAGTDEPMEPGDDPHAEEIGPRLRPRGLAIYDLANRICSHSFAFVEPLGTIQATGTRHALSLYRHPKLIDLSTGNTIHIWSELNSGLQVCSIVGGLKGDAVPPPMAFDPTNNRFAIVNDDAVTVIQFNLSALDLR